MEPRILTPHAKDVKSIFYSEKLKKLVSCSIDGKLKMTDLESGESDTLMEAAAFVGAVETSDAIIVACVDGVIVRFGFDDTVKQLELKCKGRPSALYATGDILLVGDWEGNLYQHNMATGKTGDYQFPSFQFDGREVPNGVYAISVTEDKKILVGLSSGHLVVGQKGNFSLYPLHEKAIRCIRHRGPLVYTCGNDGRVYETNLVGMQAREISSLLTYQEYIFGLDLLDDGTVVHAGSNLVAEGIDPSAVEHRFVVPMPADCWCVCHRGTEVFFGLEDGRIFAYDISKQRASPDAVIDFGGQIPVQKFSGGAQNLLDRKKVLRFAKMEEVVAAIAQQTATYGTCSPVFLVQLGEELTVILASQNTISILGRVDPGPTHQKILNPYDGKEYDLCFKVQSDIRAGEQLFLYMNIGEDAYVCAKRFLSQTDIQLDGQSDQIDQIQQIREFVDRNAPKVCTLDQFRLDSGGVFRRSQKVLAESAAIGGASSSAQELPQRSAEIDHRTLPKVEPGQTQRGVAEKAFGHLKNVFNDLELDDACQLFDGTLQQLAGFNITEPQEAALICVYSFALQDCKIKVDEAFQDFVLLKTLQGSRAEKTFALRILARVCDRYTSTLAQRHGDALARVMEEFDTQDVEALVVRLAPYGLRKCFSGSAYIAEVVARLTAAEQK